MLNILGFSENRDFGQTLDSDPIYVGDLLVEFYSGSYLISETTCECEELAITLGVVASVTSTQ